MINTIKTCGRKTDGIRCGVKTVRGQSYCPEHKKQYGSSGKKYGGSMEAAYGTRDRSILDAVWRRHAKRIRRHKAEWDVNPVPNDEALKMMLMDV